MKLILVDVDHKNLFPLTLTRSVADVRCGIFTLKVWWQRLTNQEVFVLTEKYLQPLYEKAAAGEYLFINSCIIPHAGLWQQLVQLPSATALHDEAGWIGGRVSINDLSSMEDFSIDHFQSSLSIANVDRLHSPASLFLHNASFISAQFPLTTIGKETAPLPGSVQAVHPENIFIEPGAQLEYCFINASGGPVYIGKNAHIMDGSAIRGPAAICEGAVLKMGSKIFAGTTIGPYCVVGGEIKNSIMMGNSNKAHDGYLGDSVIGEWCNLGAGTSNSNLKNNAGTIKLYNALSNAILDVGKKCGVIMGDHSRTAINTSINTGTVVGVSCNVVSNGLTPGYIPSFSWGTADVAYQLEKALNDINSWMKMKNKSLDMVQEKILRHIFEHYR